MNDPIVLPTYLDEDLAGLSPPELTDILIENEDRAPRNVIDECARRGNEMTEHIGRLHRDGFLWQPDAGDDVWWLRLHAVMILGLMPTEQAGLLLLEFMRRMSLEDDDNLQGWLAGYWAALFRNKPDSVLSPLHALCENRDIDWYIRTNAIDPIIAAASRQGTEVLEQALAWVAGIASDETEEWNLRLLASDTLLDYPRAEYRPLLEGLADRQSGWWRHFDRDSVQRAYSDLAQKPDRFDNPWKFYEPDAITQRQIRWREEDEKANLRSLNRDADYPADPYDLYYVHEPYIRPEPKIGRNDPCP